MIREVVRNTRSHDGHLYYYPENLDQDCDLYATLILSKYKVRFGRMQYQINNELFPEQAFCEF